MSRTVRALGLLHCLCVRLSVSVSVAVANDEGLKHQEGKYDLDFKNDDSNPEDHLTGEQMLEMYKGFTRDFPVDTIEDPYDQGDWDSYVKMTVDMTSCQVVGDDLLVTNPALITTGLEKKTCNALLLKVNQIGSVLESIKAAKMSMDNGWGVMFSHRSGETEECFIVDLVVGLGTGQIKTGAPCRSERTAKYNQLLRIEEELGKDALYVGENFRTPQK